MRFHDITTDDMKNGEGLRTILWVSGCDHKCHNCQNQQTWDPNDGIPFDEDSMNELLDKLNHDYISGLTLSGGDPLYHGNRDEVLKIISIVKKLYPDKTIWLYTGYTFEELVNMDDYLVNQILKQTDVVVDGLYVESLSDVKYPWAGSTNQRVIDVQKTLVEGEIVQYVVV